MITLHAYAKINLGLRIIGILPNGYHAIHSLFLPIRGLHDILTFKSNDSSIEFSSNDALGIASDDNLIVKAAKSLQYVAGISQGATIILDKRIPAGAGLGGGSSDAAFTLRGLSKLWNLNLKPSDLQDIALHLGSDVPFFLQDHAAIVEGQGEKILPIEITMDAWIVIVFPGIHIGTAWAYAQVKEYAPHSFRRFDTLIQDSQIVLDSEYFVNDFEKPIHAVYPALSKIKSTLMKAGAQIALMSGSGSTMFGVFTNKVEAEIACEYLNEHKTLILHVEETPSKERKT